MKTNQSDNNSTQWIGPKSNNNKSKEHYIYQQGNVRSLGIPYEGTLTTSPWENDFAKNTIV